jgi:NAD+ diphosphatase
MIGCVAQVLPSGDAAIKIDPLEISEARWFTRDETASLLARTHPEGLWVPGPQAIAHHLIRTFVDDVR